MSGLSIEQSGFILGPVTAPDRPGVHGELSFQVLKPDGMALRAFAPSHERELHLIVVREDGAEFAHVHPRLDRDTGTWSLPWEWKTGGTYRVITDFVGQGDTGEQALTLARTVHVSGDFSPETPTVATTASVDGFDLTVSGGIVAGDASDLVISVLRDGQPVASLQPYLGAFGHLVALRDGDLAYLHVHPEGEAPTPGEVSGPRVSFVAHAPTPGLYLLYFDFQVDGQVHSGRFVLQAVPGDATGHAPSDIPEHGH